MTEKLKYVELNKVKELLSSGALLNVALEEAEAAATSWPMLNEYHLMALFFAYNEGYSKAVDGRKFDNPFAETGSQARAWEMGTRDGSKVAEKAKSKLQVWFGAMPESNGKTNWTAILHAGDIAEGFTIARSEYKNRVRYEADRVSYLLGDLATDPDILYYDHTEHSGYVDPDTVPETYKSEFHITPSKKVLVTRNGDLFGTYSSKYAAQSAIDEALKSEEYREGFSIVRRRDGKFLIWRDRQVYFGAHASREDAQDYVDYYLKNVQDRVYVVRKLADED